MSVSLPHPSSRLLRAAEAERADLARHRARLADRRGALLAELAQIEGAMAVLDERLTVLGRLTGASDESAAARSGRPEPGQVGGAGERAPAGTEARAGTETRAETETSDAVGPDESREVLRGPAIREAAVKIAVTQPQRIEALHYRQWFELLQQAGYAVAGKDPMAVFLTQVTRSPVVRKATQPGVYEVDRQAPLRIRQRLERLQSELRELTATPSAPFDLAGIRARRHELDREISQYERALEEALRVLSPGAGAAAAEPRDAATAR